ncbi:hypothetical protein Tco_0075076, partial [Tanacetum coccineum]
MPLQQTLKSSMTWLRPHHTRLEGRDEIDRADHARLKQTSKAYLWRRTPEQTSDPDNPKETSNAGT